MLCIKEVENLNCVTKDKAKKALFSIEFNKKALKISKDIKVNKGVKKILDIITVMACADEISAK
ncbi:hypothetical protein RirG_252270 [Rhizophagus irregularis DAOM 197198w]|uniref:Uncharacterized protein n=2 Tax=Rhizophagus irregularis TaxID=588596 RepID=A0A015I644_RHIIW|nr:hypothetical protein RirG_252270 [Rhizophagus irregularis DAOM 197198w]